MRINPNSLSSHAGSVAEEAGKRKEREMKERNSRELQGWRRRKRYAGIKI